jgi:hypothetical protein
MREQRSIVDWAHSNFIRRTGLVDKQRVWLQWVGNGLANEGVSEGSGAGLEGGPDAANETRE